MRSYIQTFHLQLVEDIGSQDYPQKYLRPLGRDLDVFAGERVTRALVE